MKKLIISTAFIFILVGCSDFDDSICLNVPQVTVEQINNGSNTDGVLISDTSAVSAGELFYVAGELHGPGLENNGHYAVFRVTNMSGYAGIASADSVSEEFFDWGRPNNIDSTKASEAEKCLRKSQS